MTKLARFKDAFASVRIATYQPLVLGWISRLTAGRLMRSTASGPLTIGPPGASTAGPSGVLSITGGSRPSPADDRSRIEEEARFAATLQERLRAASEGAVDLGLGGAPLPVVPQSKAEWLAALTHIGIVHHYRQLFFDRDAGYGPIEHAFPVAPGEEVEVVLATTRRVSVEETREVGIEVTHESSQEARTLEEISERVGHLQRREETVGVAGDIGASVAILDVGVDASYEVTNTTETSRERVRSNTREAVRRSSEQMRQTQTLHVRTATEETEQSTQRRLIRNTSATVQNYALRRVLRKVRVKLQDLGAQLCWQIYVDEPGYELALSDLLISVDAEEAEPAGDESAPSRPARTVQGEIQYRPRAVDASVPAGPHYMEIAVETPEGHRLDDFVVLRLTLGPNSLMPALLPVPCEVVSEANDSTVVHVFLVNTVGELTLAYRATFVPRESTDTRPPPPRARPVSLAESIARVTAQSRVAPRAEADLRREERYALLQRIRSDYLPVSDPSFTIELFHRYFDEAALFYQVHPSWWVPRRRASREPYDITEQSMPARFGSSLAWRIQVDGDRRRNELLNSPWARACIPVRPGMERLALTWLAQLGVEGSTGLDLNSGAAGKVLTTIEARRRRERESPGPDYAVFDETPTLADASGGAIGGAGVKKKPDPAPQLYPVIDEVDTVIPTPGFVYEEISIE
jgi:hypothetical protein